MVLASHKINPSLLKTIFETKNLKLGKAIHAHFVRLQQYDIIQSNYLINLYVKTGYLLAANHVFNSMPEKNIVSFSTLMAGYLHSGFPQDVLSMFKSLAFHHYSLLPNEYIFTTVLSSCSDLKALCQGTQCHTYMLKSGLNFDGYVQNALLHMYSVSSGVHDALKFYKTMRHFDIFAFNSMINVFIEHRYLNEAADIMKSMTHEVNKWDQVTYVSLLGLSADTKNINLGSQFHCQVLKRGFKNGTFCGSALVDMYGKCNDVFSACLAFDSLLNKNVVSWTAIMAVCTQNGFFEDAMKYYLQMASERVNPNELTYSVVLNSCGGLSSLRDGEAIHALAEKSGHKKFLNANNALINMYSRCGCILEARKVFLSMHGRDVISWNSIITGYSHHGLGHEALEAFNSMLNNGLNPTYVTFVGVLSACCHLGLVQQGFDYLNFMKRLGIKPGLEHHTCIVGILCRSGFTNEAENYMKRTVIDWDVVAWRSLLTGCWVHKNFEFGKIVANHILELDPNDDGTYIILSNMYAKERHWDKVAEIRKLMRGRYVKKEPGVSWVQVRNGTHVFASDDNQHPLMDKIREKLVEIIERIKLIGYVPDIESVLHDVGDEQKEEYISFHSEKLALAFALISTNEGETIRIMKNLRVCNDCHVVMKLISSITGREIVLRDANRFHSFWNGVCSCSDYW